MKPKTRAEIATEIKKLRDQDKQLIKDKKVAYATGITKAIKAGHLDAVTINNALNKVVKSKKDRALLEFATDPTASQSTPSTSTS